MLIAVTLLLFQSLFDDEFLVFTANCSESAGLVVTPDNTEGKEKQQNSHNNYISLTVCD